MRCEICGRSIIGKPRKIIVERAKLIVCEECSKLGIEKWENVKPQRLTKSKSTQQSIGHRKLPPLDDELVLIDDYGLRIKIEREKRGWSQEELASKINEKASFISKIETGKIIPNMAVTRKLEHIFGVKLTTTVPQVNIETSKTTPVGLTIGDLISSLSNKKGEAPESNPG